MGGSASITDIGLMLIMNVLLISNFFFVRHLRKIVDKNGVESNNEDGGSRRTLTRLKLMEQSSTSLVKRLQSFYNSSNSDPATSSLVDQSGSQEVDDSSRKWTFARIRDTAHVIALGKHRLEPCTERPFTNWEPIPMKMGVMSTALALMVTTLLLSTELYHSKIPDAIRTSDSTAGFCAANATSTKLGTFKDKILNETNYSISKMQWDDTNEFREALLNDTTLYGTEGFECPPMNDPDTSIPVPTSKSKYDLDPAKLKYGPYFPGFCPMARESAIKTVATHPCQTTKEICVPVGGSTESDVQACGIIEVPITCLPHSRDDLEGAVSNYRVKQLKMRDQQDTDSMGESMDARMEQDRGEATEFLRRIFKQISLAGTFYSFYIALGLFFPTPLRLFRPSFIVQAKRIIFGAHKYTFIATFLIIWWAIQYTGELLKSTEVKVYINSIIDDPCFLDVDFIKNRTHFVREICTDLIKLGNDWNQTKNQIDPIREEIELFNSTCGCSFPGENLMEFKPSGDDMIGFNEVELGSQNVWAPKSDFTFLGNDTICRNFTLARETILESSDENVLSFVQLWITSGLLATFIVKIAITNFGVALLKLADPFCTCGGKYESPPIRYTDPSEGSVEETAHLIANDRIKEDKAASLRALAIRESLIWGFIANASLISLLVAAVQNIIESKVEYTDQDYAIGGILIFITIFMVPLICIILATCMSIVVEVDEADYDENDIEDPNVGKSGNKSNVTQVDPLGFPLKNIRNEEIDSTPSSPESGLTSMSSELSSEILSVSSNSCQGSPVQRSMQPKTILPSSFNNKSIHGQHKTSSNSCQGSPVQRLIQPKTILPNSFNNKSIHGQHESKISDEDVDVDIDSDLSTSTPLLSVDKRNKTMTETSQIESEEKTSPNHEGSGYINSDHSSTLSDGTEHQDNSTTDYSLDDEPAQKKSLSTGTPQGGSVLVDERSLSSEETDDRSITDLL